VQNVARTGRNAPISTGVSQGRRISHGTYLRKKVLAPTILIIPLDEVSLQPRRFLIQVKETLETLLSREDSDKNYQITIDDKGPKVKDTSTAP
jgi:alpha,alpha-trehalase